MSFLIKIKLENVKAKKGLQRRGKLYRIENLKGVEKQMATIRRHF